MSQLWQRHQALSPLSTSHHWRLAFRSGLSVWTSCSPLGLFFLDSSSFLTISSSAKAVTGVILRFPISSFPNNGTFLPNKQNLPFLASRRLPRRSQGPAGTWIPMKRADAGWARPKSHPRAVWMMIDHLPWAVVYSSRSIELVLTCVNQRKTL